MNAEAPRVAIAMGDPAGISPELMAKLLSQHDLLALAAITVIGDRRVLALGEKAAGLALDIETVDAAGKAAAQPGKPIFLDLKHLDPATIPMAQATAEGGKFAMRNFGEALTAAKARRFDGIMFTPFNKLAFKRAGNPYPDEIRWASDLLGWNGACSEYNKLDNLWNARVTSHEPLREVPDMLTHDRIVSAIEATDSTLRRAGIETSANRSSGTESACGRRWRVRSRGNRRDRASGGDGGEGAALRRKAHFRRTRYGCARGVATTTWCSACITTRDRSRSNCSASSAALQSSAGCRSRSRRPRTARRTTFRARGSRIHRRQSRHSARW